MNREPTNVSELVERLRARVKPSAGGGLCISYEADRDCHEAADEITRLRAEIDRLSPPLPSTGVLGRVEIKTGDPDYERFNLTVSDEARERLAQKPSAAPVDCVVGALPSTGVESDLSEQANRWRNEWGEAQDRIDRLREALEPFAQAADGAEGLDPATAVAFYPATVADLRRARAALSALPLDGDGPNG